MDYYIHDIPGRLRVKTPLFKGSIKKASAVSELVEQIPGIKSVTVNTNTGSMVITYNPKLVNSREIIRTLENTGYFDTSKAITNDQLINLVALKAGKTISKQVSGLFIDRALGNAVPLISFLI